jgi:hypothetical protein
MADSMGKSRIILIGALRMCRTVECLPSCISLAYPGFRSAKDKLQEIKQQLEKHKQEQTDTMVMDLISNIVFMGNSEDMLRCLHYRQGTAAITLAVHLPQHPTHPFKKTLEICACLCKILLDTELC